MPYYWAPVRVLGGLVLVAGLIVLVQAFVRFVVEGFEATFLVFSHRYRARNPHRLSCTM